MNAAACPNEKCNEFLNLYAEPLPTECTKCKAEIGTEHVETFMEIMELTKIHVENMKDIACEYRGFPKLQILIYINIVLL